jgi:uncharacterized protein (DUF58 family)
VVAALGYVAMARADSVRIACLVPQRDTRFGPFTRRSRMPELVRALAQIAPAGLVDLNAALATCLPDRTTRQPLVVIVSDLLTADGVAAGLDTWRARQADAIVLHIVSPDELWPDVSGEVELVDAETNATLELGVSLDTLRAYRDRFTAWLNAREAECTAAGMRYARLTTDRPLTEVVLDDLRRASVLR